MSKRLVEHAITRALEAIDPGGRSSTKFFPVARTFADFLSLDVDAVGVKWLADRKNYGNRISEATGADIEVLILLGPMGLDRPALARAILGRSLRTVPVILLVQTGEGWEIELQYVPEGDPPPIPKVPVEIIESASGVVRDEPDPGAVAAIESLEGVGDEQQLDAMLNSLSSQYSNLRLKRCSDLKNLKNRIREGMGGVPGTFLFRVPKGLLDAARKELSRPIGDRSIAACFVVSFGPGGAIIERIGASAKQGDALAVSRPSEKQPDGGSEFVESENLEYRQLERVKQLRRFLPLDANAENLFEEHLDADQRLQYETKTLGYLKRLVARQNRSVVVLTGNAGHGKTHMCRRLLEQGADPDEVMMKLHEDIEGRRAWNVADASLPVRVVKDLSELEPPERAAEILSELTAQQEAHVVICANEGRLRDVVSRSPASLEPILQAIDRGLERGETNPESDASLHVINLNFQAAVADDGGFFKHVLTHFLDNQSAWNVCAKCRAHPECPILGNRNQLTLSPSADQDNSDAREALMDLARIAEESGYVLTYRETLVLVAYLVTGGLTCEEVERLHSDGRRRERLKGFGLLDLLFDNPLSEDQAEILRVLQGIKRLDPGRIALRPVDEELHQSMERAGWLGAGVFGEDSVQLKTKRDLDREVSEYRELVRNARRRSWLRSSGADEERLGVSRSQRLGFSFHRVFRSLHEGPAAGELVEILRRLVKGLHTIQGAVNVESKTSLHLVDPSFGRSGNHSAIIARSLRIKDLELWPESRWWRERRSGGVPPILESLEWIDRRVLLVDHSAGEVLLSLDLAAFEFLMSSADGVVMREFHAADRRRILTRLAHHAEKGRRDDSDEIRVLLERGDGTLTVERDGTILLERS